MQLFRNPGLDCLMARLAALPPSFRVRARDSKTRDYRSGTLQPTARKGLPEGISSEAVIHDAGFLTNSISSTRKGGPCTKRTPNGAGSPTAAQPRRLVINARP